LSGFGDCGLVGSEPGPWSLLDVEDVWSRWCQIDEPSQDLRFHVLDWLFTRRETPRLGLRRDPAIRDLWFGEIPGTRDEGQFVVLSAALFVFETTRTVKLDSIAWLSWPL
jgi:hypothetical protein